MRRGRSFRQTCLALVEFVFVSPAIDSQLLKQLKVEYCKEKAPAN